MPKQPSFDFYPEDYQRDTKFLSLPAKGAWTDCLCAMWFSQNRGRLSMPLVGYARLWGVTVEQAVRIIAELTRSKVALREEEVFEKAKELAHAEEELENVELKKKAEMQALGEKIKAIKGGISTISRAIRSGEEYRDVDWRAVRGLGYEGQR